MPKIFIGIGSNLGSRESYLEFAKKELLGVAGLTDLLCSPVYETEPMGAEGGPFLNAVWCFETDLLPQELLKKIQEIEVKANRQRNKPNSPSKDSKVNWTSPNANHPAATKAGWGNPGYHDGRENKSQDKRQDKPNEARTLDLDILFYGDQVIREPGMTVPHPRLHERAFVLEPFCDLEPAFIHPALKKTMKEILRSLNSGKRGTGNVRRIRSTFPEDRSPKNYETHPRS